MKPMMRNAPAKIGVWSTAFCAIISDPGTPLRAFTIIPAFDSTITSDPQAATIENTINLAIQTYETNFSDPITVTILFEEMNGGLGASGWTFESVAYPDYLAALKSHATSSYDQAALTRLPNGLVNPVNGSGFVNVQLANARVLGLAGDGIPGDPDGTVRLNTARMNLDRVNTDPGKWDLMAVASHEIDEVLGFASALNGLTNGAPAPTGNLWPEDLFRYDQNGNRSLDTDITTQAYFSLDGATRLARFNQTGGGDFSDWFGWQAGVIPQVQDDDTLSGAMPNLGVELIALDILGYSLGPGALAPVIGNLIKADGQLSFSWVAGPGLTYQTQYATNLSSGNWLNLGNAVTAPNNALSASDLIGSTPQRFYRVVLLP